MLMHISYRVAYTYMLHFFILWESHCVKTQCESYFHALHDVTTGRAQSHGFRGWTGNGDARNAHRSAAQNGNGSGRETGGSLVSSSPPPSSSSNISGRHGQRNPDLSGGPGILSLDLRNTSAAFFPLLPFPSDKTEAAEPSAALRQ